jgi:UDP-N-acetylmuramoyl-L-alanyl-D-glutamate--2,6-diaminopimelate ligase
MEAVSCGQPFSVIIDHAHTPAALSMCLEGLRESTSGRLLVVFGSAGDQDSSKRPLLGFQVARFADVAVIANEDPRTERPDDIARAVMSGVGKTSAIFEIIHDRAEAITRVVEMAVPGDTVLLAGKGHERTIEFSEDVQPWNEREVAESLLQSLGYRSDV